MLSKKILFSFSLALSILFSFGQFEDDGFFMRPTIGLVGAQIDGDNYAGYQKPGIFAGAFVGRNFNDDWAASFGLGFIQKGANKYQNVNKGDYLTYKVNINYIDVPVQVTRKFRAMDLYAGLTYSQKISYSETSNLLGIVNNSNQPHSFDFGWMIGAEKQLKNKWYFGFRFNYSLLPMRDFFYSPAQPEPVYYNIWGKLFHRGFYNNILMFYFSKEINPRSKSDSR